MTMQLCARSRRHGVTVTAMAADVAVATGPRRIILWFRNDLRLRDNIILHEAVKMIREQGYNEVGGPQICMPNTHIAPDSRMLFD
jgi:hypothetical protein